VFLDRTWNFLLTRYSFTRQPQNKNAAYSLQLFAIEHLFDAFICKGEFRIPTIHQKIYRIVLIISWYWVIYLPIEFGADGRFKALRIINLFHSLFVELDVPLRSHLCATFGPKNDLYIVTFFHACEGFSPPFEYTLGAINHL